MIYQVFNLYSGLWCDPIEADDIATALAGVADRDNLNNPYAIIGYDNVGLAGVKYDVGASASLVTPPTLPAPLTLAALLPPHTVVRSTRLLLSRVW